MTTSALLELDQGDWEGKLRAEVYTPEILAQMKADILNFEHPNGESRKTAEGRALQWFYENITPQYTEGRIAIFGHGILFKGIMRNLLKLTPDEAYNLILHNTYVTRLSYVDRQWSLIVLNDTSHLSDDGKIWNPALLD